VLVKPILPEHLNWSTPVAARSLTTSRPMNPLEPPSFRWKPAAPACRPVTE
jgi:hypothetical protein